MVDIFPTALPTIGPATAEGFYYDFALPTPLTPEDLQKIELRMQKSVQENTPFIEQTVSREEAIEAIGHNSYKMEILNALPEGSSITLVSHGNGVFVDLCRGGHVQTTGELKDFKLLKVAGAYWRGKESNPMLQRVYGTAWDSPTALREYLNFLEEAEKRDHRRIGRQIGLFFFDSLAPSSPFFLPKGTIVINELINYVRQIYKETGFNEVITPQIFDIQLWKKSGHYQNYKESMYFTSSDNLGIKPMNCPAAALIFRSESHSYRDLPIKLADFGRLHRNERTGVTHGLARVRSFSQDDAHIFCSTAQIQSEILEFLRVLEESYKIFGFKSWEFSLSTKPINSIGSNEAWEQAENMLIQLLKQNNYNYSIEEGQGAFYGPKIDTFVSDAIGRKWQLGTVQIDFSLPERFDLLYTNQNGVRERPVVIHRAMLGSLERFIGILIEHLSGVLPLWLAPIQSIIIPIADRHIQYAEKLKKELILNGIRATINQSNTRMSAKIREARLLYIPYMLIVGDKEEASNSISVRSLLKGDLGNLPATTAIDKLVNQVLNKKFEFQ